MQIFGQIMQKSACMIIIHRNVLTPILLNSTSTLNIVGFFTLSFAVSNSTSRWSWFLWRKSVPIFRSMVLVQWTLFLGILLMNQAFYGPKLAFWIRMTFSDLFRFRSGKKYLVGEKEIELDWNWPKIDRKTEGNFNWTNKIIFSTFKITAIQSVFIEQCLLISNRITIFQLRMVQWHLSSFGLFPLIFLLLYNLLVSNYRYCHRELHVWYGSGKKTIFTTHISVCPLWARTYCLNRRLLLFTAKIKITYTKRERERRTW